MGANFDYLTERKTIHTWYGVHQPTCDQCGISDLVAYCANHHDEGCQCSNPPCPPTREEIEAHNKKFAKDDKYDVQVTTTADKSNFKQEYYSNKVFSQTLLCLKPGDTVRQSFDAGSSVVTITEIQEHTDMSTMEMRVASKCICSKHGSFRKLVSMTTYALSDLTQRYDPGFVMSVRYGLTDCPSCQREVKGVAPPPLPSKI